MDESEPRTLSEVFSIRGVKPPDGVRLYKQNIPKNGRYNVSLVVSIKGVYGIHPFIADIDGNYICFPRNSRDIDSLEFHAEERKFVIRWKESVFYKQAFGSNHEEGDDNG